MPTTEQLESLFAMQDYEFVTYTAQAYQSSTCALLLFQHPKLLQARRLMSSTDRCPPHQTDGAVHGLSHAEGAAQPVHADASLKPSDGLIAALHPQPAHWLHTHTATASNANKSQGSAQARASSLVTQFQSIVSATGTSAAQRIAQAASRGWSLAEVEEGLLNSMVYSFTLLTLHSKRWSRQPHDAHYVELFPQPVPQQLRVISRYLSIFKAGSSVSEQFETAQRDVQQDSGVTWLEERSEDADEHSLCTTAAALCQELRSLKLLSANIPRDVAKLMPQQLQPAYVLGLLRCKPEVQQGYADQFADFLIDLAKHLRDEAHSICQPRPLPQTMQGQSWQQKHHFISAPASAHRS